jgi:tight adherence protein C
MSGLAVTKGIPILRQRRQRRDAERELPGTIELLVLSIHAGLTPSQAIREVANSAHEATRSAFVEVVHRMDRGEPLAEALGALPEMLGPRAVGLAEVTGSAARYGLPLSQVLDQLSSEARNTRRRLDEAAARKLPVQLSFPLVVCTLPSFVLLAIAPAVIAALSSLGRPAL